MNRYKKEAMAVFQSLSSKRSIIVLSDIFSSDEYKSLRSTYGIDFSYSHLKGCLWNFISYKTINGTVFYQPIIECNDKLKDIEFWCPNGSFGSDRSGYYFPLGSEIRTTKLLKNHIEKNYERLMLSRWADVKTFLRSNNPTKINTFDEPRLKYDPNFEHPQDVYIIQEANNKFIKIGITKDIEQRLSKISKEYAVGAITIRSVIPYGGPDIEKALHTMFNEFKVNLNGYGREWFYYKDKIEKFITDLNNAPIKSDFINSLLSKL